MKITLSGRRYDISDKLKDIVDKKLSKLDKFFRDDAEAKVTITGEKGDKCVMEVTVFSDGIIYRAEERGDEPYTAIDRILTVIERQIRKNKTRLEKKLRDNAFDAANFEAGVEASEETEFNVIKTKKIALKPMSTEEAILQMNLLGHNFFVFKDDVTEETRLVYKRNDKNYGLIEMN